MFYLCFPHGCRESIHQHSILQIEKTEAQQEDKSVIPNHKFQGQHSDPGPCKCNACIVRCHVQRHEIFLEEKGRCKLGRSKISWKYEIGLTPGRWKEGRQSVILGHFVWQDEYIEDMVYSYVGQTSSP